MVVRNDEDSTDYVLEGLNGYFFVQGHRSIQYRTQEVAINKINTNNGACITSVITGNTKKICLELRRRAISKKLIVKTRDGEAETVHKTTGKISNKLRRNFKNSNYLKKPQSVVIK